MLNKGYNFQKFQKPIVSKIKSRISQANSNEYSLAKYPKQASHQAVLQQPVLTQVALPQVRTLNQALNLQELTHNVSNYPH